MILVECPQALTSHMTSILKPYIGEAHLISSILVLTHLMATQKFSFFGKEETFVKLKRLISPNVCINYNLLSCDVAFIDVTTFKKEFYNLFLFKDWVDSLKSCRKILLYDVFKEESDVFRLSEYILLKDDILIAGKT